MGAATEMTFAPLLLLAVVGVMWYALNRALFGDVLSPFSLLFPGWVMPLIVQTMNLSMYERSWRLWPSLTVIWVTFALTGTCVLSAWLLPRNPAGSRRHDFVRLVETPLRSMPFLLAFLVIYAVSFGAYLYAEFITNPIGIPLVAALQGRFTSGTFHRWGKDSPLAALSALLLILTPMAYAAYRANRGRALRGLLLLVTALFPAMAVLKLTRSDLFASAVAVGAVALVFRRFHDGRSGPRQLLKFAALSGLVLVAFYIMMGIRIADVGEIYSGLTGFRVPGTGPLHDLSSIVYGYTALPFDNLNRFLSAHDGTWHPGLSVLRPFLSIGGLGSFADRLNAEIEYPPYVSIAAENDTFLTIVYAELGVVGIAVVPIVYAALVSILYVRMRLQPSFGNVLLYINFLYPWLWLFFNNGFGVLSIYLNAAVVVFLTLYVAEFRAMSRARLAAGEG